jgi:hypothetical protein
MGGFPSGQREQTVNLSSMTSVVRIHHLPPTEQTIFLMVCFFLFHFNDNLQKRRQVFPAGVLPQRKLQVKFLLPTFLYKEKQVID